MTLDFKINDQVLDEKYLYLNLQKMLIEYLHYFRCIHKTTVDKVQCKRLFSNGDLDYHEWYNALKRFFLSSQGQSHLIYFVINESSSTIMKS